MIIWERKKTDNIIKKHKPQKKIIETEAKICILIPCHINIALLAWNRHFLVK
jgi:hypothetical protein